jgi:hypothetical protein
VSRKLSRSRGVLEIVPPRPPAGLWLAALLAAPLAACARAPFCHMVGCQSGFFRRYALNLAQPLEKLAIQVCKNGHCVTGSVTPQAVVGTGNGGQLGEHVEVTVFTLASGYRLHVSYYVRDRRDGDTYDISATDQAGHPLLRQHETVTYVPFQPNGARCAPICMMAKPQPNP